MQEDEYHAVELSLCSITTNQSREQEHPPPPQWSTAATDAPTSPSLGWVREVWGTRIVNTLHRRLTRLIKHCSFPSLQLRVCA